MSKKILLSVLGLAALVSSVVLATKAAGFMEMARSDDGRFQLIPKPEYRGRVTLKEIVDQSGALQGIRIDLKRGL